MERPRSDGNGDSEDHRVGQGPSAEVNIPILLIHGGFDPLNSPDGARNFFEKVTFPDKKMKIYPGSYHEAHNDLDYAQVMNDMAQWLERHR